MGLINKVKGGDSRCDKNNLFLKKIVIQPVYTEFSPLAVTK